MKLSNKKGDSIWSIVKFALKEFFKAETSSPGGK